MASPLTYGRALTSATTGAAVTLVGRSCKLLGFFASATTTLTINDVATAAAAAAGNQQGAAITACAVGWNPLPIELLNGLTVTQGAALTFVVAE